MKTVWRSRDTVAGMINRRRTGLVLLFCSALLASVAASADEDFELARKLVESGQILPLETILEKYSDSAPGKILEVEFEVENGVPVYEIEWLAPDGHVSEWYIDAKNGQRLEKGKD